MEKEDDLTPIEIEVVDYLEKKRGRPTDIAKNLDLNQKSVWQALQRITAKGFISRDEFGVYSISERGKQWLIEERKTPQTRRIILAARLAHNDKITGQNLEKLEEIYKQIVNNVKAAEEEASQKE